MESTHNKLLVRIELERTLDLKKPNHLLMQKKISRDMEFYRSVLMQKIEKRIDSELVKSTDTLVVHYDSEGKRNLSITVASDTVAKAILDIAEGVFPSIYNNAKQ